MPYVAPLDPASQKIILVGSVRGDVWGVSVTMHGETATAPAFELRSTGGPRAGAYAVWLPRTGTRPPRGEVGSGAGDDDARSHQLARDQERDYRIR